MESFNKTPVDIPRRFIEGDRSEDYDQCRDAPSECYETLCWGCGLRLILPSPVPVFRCGWCGAISSTDFQAKNAGRCLGCSRAVDRVLVTTIITLIVVIICGGMWAVFPVVLPNLGFWFFFHVVVTAFLALNTLFNYCMAAFVQAGPPPQLTWGCMESVGKGGLEGYRFCTLCHKPKPPRAHHCRACRACVVEMDHHCPFIGNCVGAANLRPFILFLFFAVFSNMYVLVMSTSAIVKMWQTLVHQENMLGVVSSNQVVIVVATYLQAFLGSSLSSSVRAIGLLYLVAVGLSVTIGVGLLLHQQLRQLYDGQTFIESLQHENGVVKGIPSRRGWKNLQQVFGHGHPIFWILPKFCSGVNGKAHDK